MKTGSYAAEACEPRQVRKEATVSGYLRVTQECLVGAGRPECSAENATKEGARPSDQSGAAYRGPPHFSSKRPVEGRGDTAPAWWRSPVGQEVLGA